MCLDMILCLSFLWFIELLKYLSWYYLHQFWTIFCHFINSFSSSFCDYSTTYIHFQIYKYFKYTYTFSNDPQITNSTFCVCFHLCLVFLLLCHQIQLFPSSVISVLLNWDFLGKHTRMGFYFLLQGIFLTQGSNPGLQYCRQMLYLLSHRWSSLLHYIHYSSRTFIWLFLYLPHFLIIFSLNIQLYFKNYFKLLSDNSSFYKYWIFYITWFFLILGPIFLWLTYLVSFNWILKIAIFMTLVYRLYSYLL